MALALQITIGFIALLHLYIMSFEMFAWETKGPKVFRNFPKEFFAPTKALAANMGLYNGFLAGGLIWTFFIENIQWNHHVALFFLSCVAIAGIVGAITADKKIIVVQTVPAVVGIVLVVVQ